MMGGMMAGGMLTMALSGLVVFAVVVLLVIWLARQATTKDQPAPQHDQALTTLRRRYAAGEISQEEYRQMAQELGAPETWPPG